MRGNVLTMQEEVTVCMEVGGRSRSRCKMSENQEAGLVMPAGQDLDLASLQAFPPFKCAAWLLAGLSSGCYRFCVDLRISNSK